MPHAGHLANLAILTAAILMTQAPTATLAPRPAAVPAWALSPNNNFIFRPDSFALPGAEFDLTGPMNVSMGGSSAAWKLNSGGSITLALPPKAGAEVLVVTVTGNWNGHSSGFRIWLQQDAQPVQYTHRNDGFDAFQYSHALVLRGAGKVHVRLFGDVVAPFTIQSIQLFWVKGA